MEIIISNNWSPSFHNLCIMEIIISIMAKIGGVDYYLCRTAQHFLRWTQCIGALIWVKSTLGPRRVAGMRRGYELASPT